MTRATRNPKARKPNAGPSLACTVVDLDDGWAKALPDAAKLARRAARAAFAGTRRRGSRSMNIALADDKDALYDAAFSDKMVKYRADVDMLALMTPDDPPTYFINPGADQSPADADFDLLHHPLHAKALYEQSKTNDSNVSVDVQAYQISSGIKGDDTAIQFLLEKLK